jgi:hypothetical protein
MKTKVNVKADRYVSLFGKRKKRWAPAIRRSPGA